MYTVDCETGSSMNSSGHLASTNVRFRNVLILNRDFFTFNLYLFPYFFRIRNFKNAK